MILGYSFIITLKLLEKQKVAITLVKQEYNTNQLKKNKTTEQDQKLSMKEEKYL